ncbi:hypothetical protein H2198_004617 [Neophaeococcomyces mojaviensis]|uniref:Uncharacterized protein n=1 Tax=Neophaeococcomyces mojaviensis TaxID=3383035 RepID=A0ACC3A835_9EURO|nr:hypothetical protein H2198_004617 [Knufia sp. JES_112]
MPTLKSFAFLVLFVVSGVLGDEFPLTRFPLYTQLTQAAAYCASSVSRTYRVSYGCDSVTPAGCLCTNAVSSSKVAYAIQSCIGDYYDRSILTSATQLWASYCLTNAGVSAQDETILQDIPLYTQATFTVGYCVERQTALFITSFGCDDYTKAPCMCGNSASSMRVNDAIQSCVGTYVDGAQGTASALWSSYCDLNLKQPAVRSVGAPVSVSATLTASGSGSTQTGSKTTRSADSTPLQTSQNSPSSPTDEQDTSTDSSSSSSGGPSINWEAIGAVIGVVGIIVAVGIAWWTNRHNQWIQNALVHMRLGQNQRPQHHGMVNLQEHDTPNMYGNHMPMQPPKAWA